MVKRLCVLKKCIWAIGVSLVLAELSWAAPRSEIIYQVDDLGGDRWQYTYDVSNIDISGGIDEFTISFDADQYAGLAVETTGALQTDWDELLLYPIAQLHVDGGYDALVLGLPIDIGDTVSGFSVSFDWLGVGTPGVQTYEIVNPDTLAIIDSGWTVPEPGIMSLFVLGTIIARKKRQAN